MKTIFDTITVNYAEYSYAKQLGKQDRILFLFDLYEAAEARQLGIDLSGFFSAIKEQIINEETVPSQIEWPDGVEHVDVMIDDDNIMIESNSLKAVRHIISKFIESGYILQRDKSMERAFKSDKITKYIRIFNIIDQTSSICFN